MPWQVHQQALRHLQLIKGIRIMNNNKEKLIQLRVDGVAKEKAEQALNNSGLSLNSAIRSMIYSIASTGRTPFDGVFDPHNK